MSLIHLLLLNLSIDYCLSFSDVIVFEGLKMFVPKSRRNKMRRRYVILSVIVSALIAFNPCVAFFVISLVWLSQFNLYLKTYEFRTIMVTYFIHNVIQRNTNRLIQRIFSITEMMHIKTMSVLTNLILHDQVYIQ